MLLPIVSDTITMSLLNLYLTDGEDYRIDSTTVSVAAGYMSKSFAINIINDNITECHETFKLTFNVLTSICEVVSGKHDTTEVTIKDDGIGKMFVIMF